MMPPTFDWVYRRNKDKPPKEKICPCCHGRRTDPIFKRKLCSRCGGNGVVPA